jgi:hypothetical protein
MAYLKRTECQKAGFDCRSAIRIPSNGRRTEHIQALKIVFKWHNEGIMTQLEESNQRTVQILKLGRK